MSEQDIAFWSVCAGVAPVIGLGVVIEARTFRSQWVQGSPYWARVFVTVLLTLAGVASVVALGTAVNALGGSGAQQWAKDATQTIVTVGIGLVVTNPLVLVLTDAVWREEWSRRGARPGGRRARRRALRRKG